MTWQVFNFVNVLVTIRVGDVDTCKLCRGLTLLTTVFDFIDIGRAQLSGTGVSARTDFCDASAITRVSNFAPTANVYACTVRFHFYKFQLC